MKNKNNYNTHNWPLQPFSQDCEVNFTHKSRDLQFQVDSE